MDRFRSPLNAIAARTDEPLDERPKVIDFPLPPRATKNPVRPANVVPGDVLRRVHSDCFQAAFQGATLAGVFHQ